MRRCLWCDEEFEDKGKFNKKFCRQLHNQKASNLLKRTELVTLSDELRLKRKKLLELWDNENHRFK